MNPFDEPRPDILLAQHGVRFQKLTPEGCAAIHEASLTLLDRVGVEVHHDRGREILAKAGALVEDTRVRLPAELVTWALSVAPKGFTLHSRDGDPVMPVEGRNVFFGVGSETPNILDHRTGVRRQGTLADVREGARVVDALPNIDFLMSLFLPWELSPQTAYVEQFRAMLTHSVKPTLFLSPNVDDIRAMVAMLEAVAGSAEALRAKPRGLCYINVTHPFRHEHQDVEKLLFAAEKGVPFTYNPTVLRGASGPVTRAGAMAVGNAGELFGLVLSQLVREGCPTTLSGGTADKLDMRSMIDVYSAPENRSAWAEVARWYGIPHFGLGGASDSKLVDEQSVAEASLGLLAEALAGSNLIHDVGYMESGMSNSLAQIVILDEVIGWIKRFMEPVTVDEETLALDLIERIAPYGDYLQEDHTLEHFSEDWYPGLFDQRSYERWQAAGCLTLGQRAAARVEELLTSHETPELAPDVAETLATIVAERAR